MIDSKDALNITFNGKPACNDVTKHLAEIDRQIEHSIEILKVHTLNYWHGRHINKKCIRKIKAALRAKGYTAHEVEFHTIAIHWNHPYWKDNA